MERFTRRAPSGLVVLAGFGAALLIFAVTHFLPLPGTLHDVMRNSGGQKILDLEPAFSADGVYQRLASFGETGREAYFQMMLSMDILFPLAFTAFLVLMALYIAGRTRPRASSRWILLLLPIGYLVPDLIENLSVAWLIWEYPSRHDGLAGALGYVTLFKRISMYAALFFPIALLLRYWARGRSRGRAES